MGFLSIQRYPPPSSLLHLLDEAERELQRVDLVRERRAGLAIF